MNFKSCILIDCALLLLAFNGLFAQVVLPPSGSFPNILWLKGIWKFKCLPGLKTGTDSQFFNDGFNVNYWADQKTPRSWELQGFADHIYRAKVKEGISP